MVAKSSCSKRAKKTGDRAGIWPMGYSFLALILGEGIMKVNKTGHYVCEVLWETRTGQCDKGHFRLSWSGMTVWRNNVKLTTARRRFLCKSIGQEKVAGTKRDPKTLVPSSALLSQALWQWSGD
jgi:hypothetical protein